VHELLTPGTKDRTVLLREERERENSVTEGGGRRNKNSVTESGDKRERTALLREDIRKSPEMPKCVNFP
jgi:hypothetical protein